jgi:uncharacterized protein YfaS (alpha-2-macroglobulin family)
VDVTLPESLTTYRIMAVAGDKARGSAAATPRSASTSRSRCAGLPAVPGLGDRAHFGAVVTSQLPRPRHRAVTIKSLDPGVLEFTGADQAWRSAAGRPSRCGSTRRRGRVGRRACR